MRAEVDCIAVTDHNTGAWIGKLQDAYHALQTEPPEGFRPLYLFPGVEITVHGGVHLLAVFDPGCQESDIDAVLGAAGFTAGRRGSLDAVTEQSFLEVAKRIGDAGGLAIPAHADGVQGVFTGFSGETLRQILWCEYIVAAEVLDKSALVSGAVRAHWNGWSCVLGSDSHHPSGSDTQQYPGSRFTWVKMGEPSIEGLRLALIDGEPLSVLRSDDEPDTPNEHARLVVEGIEIRNARYAGRGSPLLARFSPWTSALIGGRGTGKSTGIEMLRLALRRERELPAELRDEFRRFATVPASRRDEGALTNETEAVATVFKDDARFRVRWRPLPSRS